MPAHFRKISQAITILAMIFAINPFHSTSAQVSSGIWEEIPVGSATNTGISLTPGTGSSVVALEIAPNGTVYVAWTEFGFPISPDAFIYVKRLGANGWEEVGTGSASGTGISGSYGILPSLGFDSNSTPYIAWAGSDEIYVRRFNGSVWEEVGIGSAVGGGISNTPSSSYLPSLAIATDGTVYVAWREAIPPGPIGTLEIYVKRFNGTAWEEVGAGSASGDGISNMQSWAFFLDLALAPDGIPYIVWSDSIANQVYGRRFNGTTWEEIGVGSASGGGISNSPNLMTIHPSIIVTAAGVVYVAWSQGYIGFNNEIYVRRFNGTTWEETNPNSASGGGISNTTTNSWGTYLANAPDGSIYLAWTDAETGSESIYVRRFDGTAWNEVGTGSASGRGISNNPYSGTRPAIAVTPNNIPYVAWQNSTIPFGGTTSVETYVRRFAQTVVPPTPTSIPSQAAFDPTISKRVELNQGVLGLPGETLMWVITVSNPSAVGGNNLLISDTFQPELSIENATTTNGVIAIEGQTVTVNLASLNPNQTVEIRITTSVITSPPNGSFTNLATLTGSGVFESAIATLDVPSGLPNTGYPPNNWK